MPNARGGSIRVLTPATVKALQSLRYPFAELPNEFSPEKCALELDDGKRIPILIWCYTSRQVQRSTHSIDERSLSSARVTDLPTAIDRLSGRHAMVGSRPRTISAAFDAFSIFLSWADRAEHEGRYERVFGDEKTALESLEGYHSHLRNQVIAGAIALNSASDRQKLVINMMSEIHEKDFTDHFESLGGNVGNGTLAPAEKDVSLFLSCAEGMFDAATALLARYADWKYQTIGPLDLEVSTLGGQRICHLRSHYCIARVADLACHAFAGIFLADSGANLQVASDYVLPDNYKEQLETPDRVGLKQKVVKFRANHKEVPVHLTAITLTRLAQYLAVRKRLLESTDCVDLKSFLVCGTYQDGSFLPPSGSAPIGRLFLTTLRRRFERVGVPLPDVTFKQLRLHKHGYIARRNGVVAAADALGHTVETAIRSYCKANAETARKEMGAFFASLEKRVIDVTVEVPTLPRTGVMAGSCQDFGEPRPTDGAPLVKPDCEKAEGCFFCENFCLHADESDLRKLLSCQHVLLKLIPLSGISASADRVYAAVLLRIDGFLEEMRERMGAKYHQISHDVLHEGNLTDYWAGKLQQLYLLQIVT